MKCNLKPTSHPVYQRCVLIQALHIYLDEGLPHYQFGTLYICSKVSGLDQIKDNSINIITVNVSGMY